MKYLNITLVWLALLLANSSCVSERVNLELDSSGNDVVAVSFLEPNTDTDIFVFSTKPYLAPFSSSSIISDASVKILHGTTEYELEYVGGSKYSIPDSDLTITAGETYQLLVEANGKQLTAETTVPVADSFLEPSVNLTMVSDFVQYILIFADIEEVDNYYALFGGIFDDSSRFSSETDWDLDLTSFSYRGPFTFSDQTFQNQSIALAGRVFLSGREPRVLRNIIYVTNENYHLYHESILDEFELRSGGGFEHKDIFSNITGGYGIFTAKTPYIFDTDLN